MGIVWSAFAEKQLDNIFDYYLENAGYKIAKSLVSEIIDTLDILLTNPETGQLEDLLSHTNRDYRYLVEKL